MPELVKIKKHYNPVINKLIVGNTCTNKLCTAATVYFSWASDLYMFVTKIALLIATSRAQVNANIL